MIFKHCPQCGEKLVLKEIGDEGEVPFCDSCSRPFFSFSYPCVICLVTDGAGQFALIKQGYVSQRYVFVAGYVQRGESLEKAAAREVEEETGLKVKSVKYLESYYFERDDNLMAGFAVTVEHGNFSLSGEVDSAEWFGEKKAGELLVGGKVCKELFGKYLSEKKGEK